jgi:aspartate aminotransferase
VFDGKSAPICYEFMKVPLEQSKVVVINGVSKMYAMTGFRIGWAVANNPLVEAMATIQSQQTSGPSSPAQWAAVGALNGVQSSVESLRLTLENNRNVMIDHLNAFEGVKVKRPEGTFYCFPDFSAYMKDSQALSNFLLDKVRVVTVPGKEFGFDGHLRLSYCGTIRDITEGVDRIKWALDPNSANELYLGERKLVREWL